MLRPFAYSRGLRGGVVLGLALILLWVIASYLQTKRAQRSVQEAVARAAESGGSLDPQEQVPSIPRGTRNASSVLNALEALFGNGRETPWRPEEDLLRAALKGSREAIGELQKGLEGWRPRLALRILEGSRHLDRAQYFQTQRAPGQQDKTPWVERTQNRLDLLNVARWLIARAHVSMALGHGENAYGDLALLFRMARWIEMENPILTSTILATNLNRRGLDALESFNGLGPPEDESRRRLLLELEALQKLGVAPELQGERALTHDSLLLLLRQGLQPDGTRPPFYLRQRAHAAILEEIAASLRVWTRLVELAERPPNEVPDREAIEAFLSEAGEDPPWLVPNILRTIRQEQVMAQRGDLVRVAFAAADFAEREGRPIAALRELVPQDLPEIPMDRFSGAPVRLRREGGSCIIYSFGEDFDDDQGRASEDPLTLADGDLTFPLPCGVSGDSK